MELKVCDSKWQLGSDELKSGDTIEVLLGDRWYCAMVQFDTFLREYRLVLPAPLHPQPLYDGAPARWPTPSPGGSTHDG
jgi:hypothetical protein